MHRCCCCSQSPGLECSSRWLVQFIRGPRPPAEAWPRVGPPSRKFQPQDVFLKVDGARQDPVHSDWAREGVGGGPEVRVDSSQSSLEATSIGCRDRSVSEVDLHVGCPMRGGALREIGETHSRGHLSTVFPPESGDQVLSLQQMVKRDAIRAGRTCEGVARGSRSTIKTFDPR